MRMHVPGRYAGSRFDMAVCVQMPNTGPVSVDVNVDPVLDEATQHVHPEKDQHATYQELERHRNP
jgi:hypothetical protein